MNLQDEELFLRKRSIVSMEVLESGGVEIIFNCAHKYTWKNPPPEKNLSIVCPECAREYASALDKKYQQVDVIPQAKRSNKEK